MLATAGQQTASVPVSHIQAKIDSLEKTIQELEAMVADVSRRFSMVMAPRDKTLGAAGSLDPESPKSDLSNILSEFQQRIQTATHDLAYMRDCCEL
jgi:SMC interacting uncharacterized protein involved in chromosome segregation